MLGAPPVLTSAHTKTLSAKEEVSVFANGEAEAQREKITCIQFLCSDGLVNPQSTWVRLCRLPLALPQPWAYRLSPLPELLPLRDASRSRNEGKVGGVTFASLVFLQRKALSTLVTRAGYLASSISILSSVKLRSYYPSQRVVRTNWYNGCEELFLKKLPNIILHSEYSKNKRQSLDQWIPNACLITLKKKKKLASSWVLLEFP